MEIDEEQIEIMLENDTITQKAGYIDYKHFRECQHSMSEGMIRFGSEFVRALGEALKLGQRDDALKIMRYWNNCAETHSTLYKMFLAKEEACR